MNILMGGGNDQLTLTDVTSQKDMTLDAGAGDDTVQLTRVSAYDNFFAILGDGNDQLTIADLYDFFGATKIDGGSGTDRLNKTGAFPTSQVTQLNFEWINGVPQLGLVASPSPRQCQHANSLTGQFAGSRPIFRTSTANFGTSTAQFSHRRQRHGQEFRSATSLLGRPTCSSASCSH